MILVTVGTQLAFDRLIDAMDMFAAQTDEPVIAQTGPGGQDWHNIDRREYLTPAEFEDLFKRARVVVGHAGIGTILSARQFQKPLVILPRRFGRGEHRNDHQLATAQQVESFHGIKVAWDVNDLPDLLTEDKFQPSDDENEQRGPLIDRISMFINAD